jgi:hypothetical protein
MELCLYSVGILVGFVGCVGSGPLPNPPKKTVFVFG